MPLCYGLALYQEVNWPVSLFVPSNGLNAGIIIRCCFFVILVNSNKRISYRVCYESQ